ncbi:hypothetical protein MMYC01_205541 [Madurella mycetomatis]|uniref:Uncharacterized protein n=1 Tax=Madurella mycetomatis TaxID=100816 RepID=A0A175VUK6_9PEZI|nr:hypothetical protein MMYC01_205908 [Madurella mycetomatis]KXX78061.1 hypothetical protein MMYC01_205541 [Madurella mycetomatis]
MPPSAIKTRSRASRRLSSLAPSPRKQTFELDVGNELSPQRLLVTVEADDANHGTNRRLFQSPTPKRGKTPQRGKTVTTSVPLRGLTDDESATPKPRGRPRKSATPVATRRKRPGTPAKTRNSGAYALGSPQKGIPASDIEDMQPTPRASAQRKKVSKRKLTPAKEDGLSETQPRKRGRPRKQPVISDDLTARLGQGNTAQSDAADNPALAPTPAGGQVGDDMEEDIWLATLSDQPTPAGRGQQSDYDLARSASDALAPGSPRPELPRPEPGYQEQYDWPEMGGGGDSYSEAESQTSVQHDDRDRQDTIMAGEEFTMISLGSLPSMQPNSSTMAPEPHEFGEATSLIINKTLEYFRQSQNKAAEEPAHEAPAAVVAGLEAAAEKMKDKPLQQDANSLPQPPPARSPQARRQSPRRTKPQPLAKQLAQKSLQQVDGPSPGPGQPAVGEVESQDASAYEDSFSEIPEAVLAAATPRRFREPQLQAEAGEPGQEDIQPSIERPSTVNHSNPQSETNRLLTPDETPSPIPSETDEHNLHSNLTRPALELDIPSSPPIARPATQQRFAGSAAQHTRTNSTETPADQLSSFASTTMAARDVEPVHLPPPEPQLRPTLSPIVRAGRALQLVTSDPPSPPARDSVLGSPFRGSVGKSSQSPAPLAAPAATARASRSPSLPQVNTVAEKPQRSSWLAPLSQIRNFVARTAQSLSPARISVSGTEGMDDPFGPDPGESAGRGSVRSTLFSGPDKQGLDRDATVSVASPTGGNALLEDDAMSWQGEGSPAGESPRATSPGSSAFATRGSSGAEATAMHQSEPPQGHEPVREAENPRRPADLGQHVEEEEEEEEEEEDIWVIEAQRPTPHTAKTAQRRQEPAFEPPRRGRIPSPWRRNGRHLVYSDELQQRSDKDVPSERAEDEEFSMLAQDREQRTSTQLKPPPTKKPDLSAFFSSPATLPDMQEAPGFALSKTLNSQQPTQTNRTAPRTVPSAAGPPASRNSLFSQYPQPEGPTRLPSVPQKQLEISNRQRSVDLFSPGRSSPEQRSTVEESGAARQKQLPTGNRQRSIDLFSPEQRSPEQRSAERAPVSSQRPASPDTPEASRAAHIPQKMNFTPRQRQPGSTSTLFQAKPTAPSKSLFGNNQISAFFSQSRFQTQPQARAQEREEQDDEEESSFIAPPLNPLPDRAASPSKSCIRSPLKPKTPGRVVEFTSSTLSPLAQAQARADRRAASTSVSLGKDDLSQGSGSGRKTASTAPSLSPTTWTRAHWQRLDALLQARKKGWPAFRLVAAAQQARHGRRVGRHRLLGKEVTSQGESMILEAWHLDVVDAFKAEIDSGWRGSGRAGWDETDLAKRVFALLVGEERRRLGLVPPRRRR